MGIIVFNIGNNFVMDLVFYLVGIRNIFSCFMCMNRYYRSLMDC